MYELCCRPLAPMSSLLFFVSSVLIYDSVVWNNLYHDAYTDLCVFLIIFSSHFHLEDDIIKLNISSFNPRLGESVSKVILFVVRNAMFCFALEVGFDHIVAEKCYSPVPVLTALLRSLEIDWDQPDCTGWYS